MSWYNNYIDRFSQDNKSYYEEMAQEYINDYFDDSTLVDTIDEELYPFNKLYSSHIVQIDSVSEISVNLDKVIGDYISVLFKDCKHRNYRGQKYIWNNDTYLCYDKINNLSKVATTKLIRCNNEINWIDKTNGKILSEKVFVGYDISSTNGQVSKTATVENKRLVMYVQYNNKTKNFNMNQRFMFGHNQCFRIEQFENFNKEQGLDEPTLIKIHLSYSPMLPSDNQELNICDYYDTDYRLDVNQFEINQIKGFFGTFTATVVNKNKDVLDIPVGWKTSNDKVVTVDKNGNYTLVGNVGDVATITAYIVGNESIYSEIKVNIVDDYLPEKKIIVDPNDILEISEMDSVNFKCGVYIEGQKQPDVVNCVASGVPNKHYYIEDTIDGYKITNNLKSKDKLQLTFSSDGCDDVVLNIKLKGLI